MVTKKNVKVKVYNVEENSVSVSVTDKLFNEFRFTMFSDGHVLVHATTGSINRVSILNDCIDRIDDTYEITDIHLKDKI